MPAFGTLREIMDQAGAVTLLCQSTMLGLVSYSNAAAEVSPGQVCLQSVAGMLPRVHEGAPAEAEASLQATEASACISSILWYY